MKNKSTGLPGVRESHSAKAPDKLILAWALFGGGVLSVFASAWPDGLEKVAEAKYFTALAVSHWPGLMPDYAWPGIGPEWLATALAGLAGVLFVLGLFKFVELIIRRA